MKRILIMGSPGTGKSTLAKRMHDILGLPLINLDKYFWKPGWNKREDFEWQEIVSELVKKDEWIIDGNHRKTLEMRLPYADAIIFLDFSRLTCLYRWLKRIFKNDRQDCIEGCKEKINYKHMHWILWGFPHVSKKLILKRLKEVEGEKKVFILKSDDDVEKFINQILI
jgi:adenylate kinase family enzyme